MKVINLVDSSLLHYEYLGQLNVQYCAMQVKQFYFQYKDSKELLFCVFFGFGMYFCFSLYMVNVSLLTVLFSVVTRQHVMVSVGTYSVTYCVLFVCNAVTTVKDIHIFYDIKLKDNFATLLLPSLHLYKQI